MTERMIEANGVEICTESFGDAANPAVLLIMGIGASMLWWGDGFCRMLADSGFFVIRYDHRDTGRSVTYELGQPGYSSSDLVDDAVGVLDAYRIAAAHIAGVSAGGALAQLLALDHPRRALSLILISTSRALPGEVELPPPTKEFHEFVATAKVDWSDAASVTDYLVEYERVLSGTERQFDEAAVRDLVHRDIERANDIRAIHNHDALREDTRNREPLSTITIPTLVIHGTADPMFPIGHGVALAAEIPRAAFVRIEGAGHGITHADWQAVTRAIREFAPRAR